MTTRRIISTRMNDARETLASSPSRASAGSFAATLRNVRRHLPPQHLDDMGWAPVWSLLYLGFLFMT